MARFINIEGIQIANKTYSFVLQLGGIDKLLEYYNAGKSFRNIRSIGEKTARELTMICRSLSGKDILKSNSESYSLNASVEQELAGLIEIYEAEKELLSMRPWRILNRIEKRYLIENNENEYKKLLYFVLSTDFINFNQGGIGQKSIWEFEHLQNALLTKVIGEFKRPIIVKEEINLSRHILDHYPDADLEELRIDGKFSMQRVVCILFRKLKISNKFSKVAESFFMSEIEKSNVEIATEVHCSIENVRNTVKKISRELLPELVNTITKYKDLVLEGIIYEDPNSYIIVNQTDPFNFDGLVWKLSGKFNELLLIIYLSPNYHFLNEIIANAINQSKVFDSKNLFYFISDKLNKTAHFSDLLKFLESEIYLFECAEFDYDLKVLIERFYRENNYEYNPQIINKIYELIINLKRKNIERNLTDVKRLKRREKKANIKQIVEDFLLLKCEAQKTSDIVHQLNENGVEIETPKLLSQMNKWSQTFARLGNGMWGLRNWIKGDAPKGSIREIVEGLLLNRDAPIHVSEVLNYFETFRPMTERSLLTNLWVSENIHFVFFNCSFIGLKIKNYSEYWSNIPRFSSAKFKTIYLNKDFDYEEKMRELENIGYPRIHCEYIISRWNQ